MFKGIDGDKLSAQDKAQREVRDAVLWVLQERLARAGEVVREMREQRMGRNVRRLESGMGAVSKVGGPGGVEVKRWDENLERGNGLEDEEVSGEMMQLLEQENREMVKGFEGMMEGVRSVMRNICSRFVADGMQKCREIFTGDFRVANAALGEPGYTGGTYKPAGHRFN